MAKSKERRSPSRVVRIVGPSGRALAVRRCSSPTQALREYFKQTLEDKGYKSPKVVGNTLQVVNKLGATELWIAVDVSGR